jgi:hypothetical protein
MFAAKGTISQNTIPRDVLAYCQSTGTGVVGDELNTRVVTHRAAALAVGRVLTYTAALDEVLASLPPDEVERLKR